VSDDRTRVSAVTIDELQIADQPARWRALGFEIDDDSVLLGAIRVRLAGDRARRGAAPDFLGWSLRGLDADVTPGALDGLPTTIADGAPREPRAAHPNGIVAVDHVVAMTPVLDRTVAALQAAGLDLRRVREQATPAGAPRQAFFRLGEAILEVVQEPYEIVARREHCDQRARLWGLALLAPDFDRTVIALGASAGEPRAAVQRGRRIVTVRRSAGLAVPLAVMSVPRER
jgi:hypothetical protein